MPTWIDLKLSSSSFHIVPTYLPTYYSQVPKCGSSKLFYFTLYQLEKWGERERERETEWLAGWLGIPGTQYLAYYIPYSKKCRVTDL